MIQSADQGWSALPGFVLATASLGLFGVDDGEGEDSGAGLNGSEGEEGGAHSVVAFHPSEKFGGD